jgi:hypothetical protein
MSLLFFIKIDIVACYKKMNEFIDTLKGDERVLNDSKADYEITNNQWI